MIPPSLSGWSKLPNANVARMAQVGPYGFAVFGVILEHADKEGLAFPSVATIAKLTGMSRRHVFRAIGDLERARWIRVEHVGKNDRRQSNRYILTPLAISDCESPTNRGLMTNSHQVSDCESLGLVTNSHPNKTHIEQDPINKTKARGRAAAVVVPKELDSEAFRQAWSDWQTYRKQRRQALTPIGQQRALAKLATWGEAKAILALQTAIEKGWQGFFEPREESTNGNNSRRSMPVGDGQRHATDRNRTIF